MFKPDQMVDISIRCLKFDQSCHFICGDGIARRFAQSRLNRSTEVRVRDVDASLRHIAKGYCLFNPNGGHLDAVRFSIGPQRELTLCPALLIGGCGRFTERSVA